MKKKKPNPFQLKESYSAWDVRRAASSCGLPALHRAVIERIADYGQSNKCITSMDQCIYPRYSDLAENIGSLRGGDNISNSTLTRIVTKLSALGYLIVVASPRGNRFFISESLFLKAYLLTHSADENVRKKLAVELWRVREFSQTNPKRFGGKKCQNLKKIKTQMADLAMAVKESGGEVKSDLAELGNVVDIFCKTSSEKLSKISFIQKSDLSIRAGRTCQLVKVGPSNNDRSIEPTLSGTTLSRTNIYKPTYDTRNNGESAGFEKVGIEKFFEFEIFTRFARALNQPQANDNQIRKFYAAYLKSPRSFEDILKNLKTLESCSALEFNERSPGNPHNLKRLLADPESLSNAAAAKRGELGKAYGFRKTPDMAAIAKICLDKGWRAEKTYQWLTDREADESFLAYYREQKSRHDAEGMRYEQARAREQADNEALEKRLKSEGPEFAEAARTMLRVIGKFRELGENLEKRFAATATLEAILKATEKRSVHGIDPEFTGHKTEAGDQGDEVSKAEESKGKGSLTSEPAKDSQTGEPSEALRGSGNERDGLGDTEAPDRNESDFQRRFRERRERAEQGGFLAGEGIENRPLAEPEQESEAEKPAKPKVTKALKQFNEQLQAGRLAPASTNVYEKIQASGKEAEAGPDHAREPEKVQPEDVKKPAPESSEAGTISQRAISPATDSAFAEVIGPENVASQQKVEVGASQSQEATPAGKTSQYDFNVPAAEMSAASNDPKNITTDSCLLSNQSGRNFTKNPEPELNLGGTGNSGGRNKPAAEASAGSDVGGSEQVGFREKQRPEAPEESSRERDISVVECTATSVSISNSPQAPQNLKPDAPKSSGPEINFAEDLCQLDSTSTDPAHKKSKPESATETGQKLIIDTFTCTHNSSAELQLNVPDQINQSLTTASPGFDETAQAVRQPTVASDSEPVDENFNGSVAAREKTSVARDCDGGVKSAAAGECVTDRCTNAHLPDHPNTTCPQDGETVTDYVLRACRVVSGGDNALWLSLWMEVDSLETDAEKINWAEQKLRQKYSKEHDITQVA